MLLIVVPEQCVVLGHVVRQNALSARTNCGVDAIDDMGVVDLLSERGKYADNAKQKNDKVSRRLLIPYFQRVLNMILQNDTPVPSGSWGICGLGERDWYARKGSYSCAAADCALAPLTAARNACADDGGGTLPASISREVTSGP